MPISRFLLGSVSLAALGMTQAAVADEPGAPGAFDWSGPYVGGNLGGAILDGDVSNGAFIIPGSQQDLNSGGFTGGAQIGWNQQTGQFVFGAESDFNFLNIEDDALFQTKTPGVVETDFDWFATVRGRAGVAVDQTLIYATLGLAIADAEISVSNSGATVSDKETTLGVVVGGGVEHWFTDAMSGKLEYLYADMQRIDVGFIGPQVSASPQLHIFRAGINYHFCWGLGC